MWFRAMRPQPINAKRIFRSLIGMPIVAPDSISVSYRNNSYSATRIAFHFTSTFMILKEVSLVATAGKLRVESQFFNRSTEVDA
jgi:hypothetical protein